MTDTRTDEKKIADEVLLEVTERILNNVLEQLRMITPEGWERAHVVASIHYSNAQWHTLDVAMFTDARKMALRGGPRFRDREYRYDHD